MEAVIIVFLKKYDATIDLHMGVKNMLNKAFESHINDGRIEYNSTEINKRWKKQVVSVTYKIQRKEKMVLVKFQTNDKTIPEICVLQKILHDIKRGYHRKDYYITVASDESSLVLSTRLYPLLSSFEKNLRRVVYESVIKMNGEKWIDETISKMEDVSNEVKSEIRKHKKSDSKEILIEEAMDNMTYGHMYSFLFNEYSSNIDMNSWKTDFSEENLNSKSKSDLIACINVFRPLSQFDILFSAYTDLNGFKESIGEIINIRNKVMHSKALSYDDYLHAKKTIKCWDSKLISVLTKIEKSEYSNLQQISLSNYYSSALRRLIDSTLPNVSAISEILVSSGLNFVNILSSSLVDSLFNSVKGIAESVYPVISNLGLISNAESDIETDHNNEKNHEDDQDSDNDSDNANDSDNNQDE